MFKKEEEDYYFSFFHVEKLKCFNDSKIKISRILFKEIESKFAIKGDEYEIEVAKEEFLDYFNANEIIRIENKKPTDQTKTKSAYAPIFFNKYKTIQNAIYRTIIHIHT